MNNKISIALIAILAVSLLGLGGFIVYEKQLKQKEAEKGKIEIEIGKGEIPPIKIESEYEKKHIRVRPFVDIQVEGGKKK